MMASASSGQPLALGICGEGCGAKDVSNRVIDTVHLGGREVRCGFFPIPTPTFAPEGKHRESVLIETSAFSCNYRDKALILRMADAPMNRPFYSIGSELCGRVAKVGSDVEGLFVGDRIAMDAYYGAGARPWGLPTNHSSRALQVLPARKFMRIPPTMSDVVAASFTGGAQTSFAMVRRTSVTESSRVLVTGGSSNTSLFLLRAAQMVGAHVSVTTTSASKVELLRRQGAANVFVIDPDGGPFDREVALADYARDAAGFEVVLDPFADLYLRRVLSVMAFGGRYASCGFERQSSPSNAGSTLQDPELLDRDGLHTIINQNLQILGNCLGTTSDLASAFATWEQGRLPVLIDRVYEPEAGTEPGAAGAFLSRTFCEPDRLGKVVYRYAPARAAMPCRRA